MSVRTPVKTECAIYFLDPLQTDGGQSFVGRKLKANIAVSVFSSNGSPGPHYLLKDFKKHLTDVFQLEIEAGV